MFATQFQIKDLGELSWFLGIRITRDRAKGTISLSQDTYATRLLEKYGLQDAKVAKTPMASGSTLRRFTSDTEMLDADGASTYREIIGSLMYLGTQTRWDIAYTLGILSRFLDCPSKQHFVAAKHVLRYIKGTTNFAITYSQDSAMKLLGYADADF